LASWRAAIAFVAWLASAGSIVNFISESVMRGFKCGAALFLASTQLPKLFGFKGGHGSFWERSHDFISHLGETKTAALLLGLAALALLVLGKIFLKNRPVALFVVIGSIIAAASSDLDARGVKLIGEVPQGLPAIGLPAIHWTDLNDLLPLALACFLLGAVETAAIGRMFTAKHGGRLDANREFLALAAANCAAALGRGFPVSGGMSQSLVNESGGARTPLSSFFAALVMLVVVLFLSGLLRYLPQPVLAATALVAITGLFKLSTFVQLVRSNRTEFIVAIAALVGVLCSGLLRGVLIGAILSLVLLIRRASRPLVAVLGRIPGSRRFSDSERHPDNEPVPGVLTRRAHLPARGEPDVIQHRPRLRHRPRPRPFRGRTAEGRRARSVGVALRGHAECEHAGRHGGRTPGGGSAPRGGRGAFDRPRPPARGGGGRAPRRCEPLHDCRRCGGGNPRATARCMKPAKHSPAQVREQLHPSRR
jgi:MFS superfamily sulfate permease-like transporter